MQFSFGIDNSSKQNMRPTNIIGIDGPKRFKIAFKQERLPSGEPTFTASSTELNISVTGNSLDDMFRQFEAQYEYLKNPPLPPPEENITPPES